MPFSLMESKKAEVLAGTLKGLACKGCTEGLLDQHDGLTDPIKDIENCGDLGLISDELRERLINEVQEIKNR